MTDNESAEYLPTMGSPLDLKNTKRLGRSKANRCTLEDACNHIQRRNNYYNIENKKKQFSTANYIERARICCKRIMDSNKSSRKQKEFAEKVIKLDKCEYMLFFKIEQICKNIQRRK